MNAINVNVSLGKNSYTIHIGDGLLASGDWLEQSALFRIHPKRQVCIVTNTVIADLYVNKLVQNLSAYAQELTIETVILPEGEIHKNAASLDLIYERLLVRGFARDCLVIALGGGVVGDIAGFAAASYQRGVAFVQIPTTLLAQVDSSVGGKTGINHCLGKNMIGAFYQPQTVVIDTDVLNTLPRREISAGMAEVIKYGLIRDKAFLHWLDDHMQAVLVLKPGLTAEAIRRACQHKAAVVEADEKDQGLRATLNLGHTFGHAIETLTNYNIYLHGEAVAIGTMMALKLSQQLGYLKSSDVEFARRLFERAGCPTSLRQCDAKLTPEIIREAMQRDKKVTAGRLRLIVLKALGHATICEGVDETDIQLAIEACLAP